MSIDHNLYIGPYVVCQNPSIEITESLKTCPKVKCKRAGRETLSAYCCDCGAETQFEDFPLTDRKVCSDEVFQAFNERLYCSYDDDLVDIWLPNIKYGVDRIDIENLDGAVPLAGDHLNEVDLFMTAFRVELDILEDAYGKDKVVVLWGIVGHYS